MFSRAMLIFSTLFLLPVAAVAQAPAKTIILIGGDTPHGPFVHDPQLGLTLIDRYMQTSHEIRALKNIAVRSFPNGWPTDPGALDDAATIVWYFDGLEHHPLLDRGRRDQIERLMRKGVGLVTFHQALTLPAGDKEIDLMSWLGAARYGMVDRTTEIAAFTPARHEITRGVSPFTHEDEFYPTIRFGSVPVTPILSALLHVEDAPTAPPTQRTIAWAFERPGGGRSFGFTGLHYVAALNQPQLRKLLLNAILWTAGVEVPPNGVNSRLPGGETHANSLP